MSDTDPQLCEVLPNCPLCGGKMETVYKRFNQEVCVCSDCTSGITVPSSTWEVIRLKREGKWHGKRN